MTMLGVSTSAIGGRRCFDDLLAYEPDVIEFYNYPSAALADIRQFCAKRDIRPALHTPVPYDAAAPLTRFAPTGPDPQQAAAALRLTRRTIRCAADLGALHVVVHFPSPYPPFPKEGFASAGAAFLDAVAEEALTEGVSVLIENLSAHPLLRTPDEYLAALGERPGLSLCLDLGHAHLMGGDGSPLAFARALGAKIASMHVYNTTADRYAVHGHELAKKEQTAAQGFMDLSTLIPALVGLSAPSAVVLEHGRRGVDPAAAARTAAWMRELITDSRARRGHE